MKCDPDKCRCVDCQNYPTDNEQESDEESSVSVIDEKDEIDYNDEEENSNIISDYQTPFEQDEDEFILTVPPLRNNVLDEKPFAFNEDVTAI